MHHLRTIMIAVLLVISASTTTTAQQWLLGAELNVGIPTGDLDEFTRPGMGHGLVVAYGVTPSFYFGASLGRYNVGISGLSPEESGRIEFLTLGISGRYMVQPLPQKGSVGMIPFVGLGVDRYFLSALGVDSDGNGRWQLLEAAWGVSPQAGVMIPLGEKPRKAGYLDPSLRFHTIFTEGSAMTMFSINIGYRGTF